MAVGRRAMAMTEDTRNILLAEPSPTPPFSIENFDVRRTETAAVFEDGVRDGRGVGVAEALSSEVDGVRRLEPPPSQLVLVVGMMHLSLRREVVQRCAWFVVLRVPHARVPDRVGRY